jgi:hypothetical protein
MLFQIYGDTSLYQLLGWVLVFAGLVLLNEFARRSKAGGIICFIVVPVVLTVYFIAILIGAKTGAQWVQNNPTYIEMSGWFHYAKLYAATIGCIGFMFLKYKWGIGKKEWFKVFPFVIVAINILIAVASDFESAIKGLQVSAQGGWWYSNEGVWLYGGWWNILNGIAGLLNILCMTGWWGIYQSKDKKDMLWPDMTWCFIIAYDVWNFEYTFNNLPNHAWYCGLALLLAPTFANAFWNKGGWIQNRANTLAIWCMFAQIVPQFQNDSVFTVLPSLYVNGEEIRAGISNGVMDPNAVLTAADANPTAQGVIAVLALIVNVVCLTAIIKRAKEQHKNPYKNEIFTDQKDYKIALQRAAEENRTVA